MKTVTQLCALAIVAVTGVLVPPAADTANNGNAGTFSFVLQNDVFFHC